MSTTSLHIHVENIEGAEKEFLATAIAVFTDPAPRMRRIRDQVMAGEIALGIDGGEVTWVNGPAPEEETRPQAASPGHCVCQTPYGWPAPGGGRVCINCNRRIVPGASNPVHTCEIREALNR